MAKDDYDLIVFKVLTYIYAVTKRKISFNKDVFDKTIGMQHIDEVYFYYVLYLMKTENLIADVTVVKVWGNDYVLISDLSEMRITAEGIHYLKDNSFMKKACDFILENTPADLIVSLIRMIF
ncbi:MAG: YjcQ family protein [Erysipelotrichaceae bacterium]|jgi:hypothetical protein